MKDSYVAFIKRVNSKEYAERLKVMIECETVLKDFIPNHAYKGERSNCERFESLLITPFLLLFYRVYFREIV